MSTITFAFHPFHDPYNFTNTHSLPQNPPSITAPTSLLEPASPANYDSWDLAPTLSPVHYGPPAGFHHGDESHGQPPDMHPPDASRLLFGSYAPPENSQLSPSTIVRHDTYAPVLGNAFNPTVAPTGLAPQAPISLPTLDLPCLAPPPSLSVQTDPIPPASQSALSDPLHSISPPGRPACSKRVSKRKRKRSVSREGGPDPHITLQLQAANQGRHSSTTTAAPKSPRTVRGFVSRGGNSSRVAPPPVPSLQPGHHQRSSPTSSGVHQHHQPQPGYPTVPVGSMDGRYPKRRRVDDGQSPSGLRVAQQQHQIAGYPAQQYQGPAQAHWYGSGAQPTNAFISQLSQPPYGYPSTSAGPSYSQHARPTHVPTRNPSMYAAPIPTAPSQWTNGSSTQGQEQYSYHSGPVAYPQLMQTQPYQQPPYISPTPATLAGSFSLADDPSSHVTPYLAQDNLTASNETPNSGAAPGGSNANVGGTSTMGGPTSLNQQIGPTRSNGNKRRQVPKPYQRPTPATRKTRPITYEGNLVRLQQRCKKQGADEGAIGLLGKVFTNEVSLKALTRPLTDAEAETKEFGVETGRVYIAFLETVNEEEGVGTYYFCRLCHSEQTWRQHKDVLRHLRRDHFGLADVCNQWYVSGRSLTLSIINMFPGDLATKSSTPKGR